MNSVYSDKLKAEGTLTGSDFATDHQGPRRWRAIYAHEESVVNITSDTMTVGDGVTTLDGEAITIPAGSTFFCDATIIEWVSGDVTCYRANAE
jgi:hypothetical protein